MKFSDRVVFAPFPGATALFAVLLSGCNGGSASPPTLSTGSVYTAPTVAPYAAPPAGVTGANQPLPMPASGSRPGSAYDVYLTTPPDGNTASFTVFEPNTVTAGQTYPIILTAPGWGGKRTPASAQATLRAGTNIFSKLLAAGYGVASLDQHGFAGPGSNSGTVNIMDPNHDAQWYLSMVNWMEVNVPWIAFGPSVDGHQVRTAVMGANGSSYGGAFEYFIWQVDDRKRLHAIAPEIITTEYNKSSAPNGVNKNWWNNVLAGAVTSVGATEDPAFFNYMSSAPSTVPEEPAVVNQMFAYHSFEEQCNHVPGVTDGDLGPALSQQPVPPINLLIMQGIRDHLFPLYTDYAGFQCASGLGGDVRYWTYQSGHNTGSSVFPDDDPPYTPAGNDLDSGCGSLKHDDAVLAWFNEKLKGQANAAAAIPKVCVSFVKGDGVALTSLTTGHAGMQFTVPSTTATVGNGTSNWRSYLASHGATSVPAIVPLYTVPAAGNVLAGISRLEVTVASSLTAPTMFVGIGHLAVGQTQWDLVNGQVQPLQGTGSLATDTAGEGARLNAGDQVALLIFGDDKRFDASSNPAAPARPTGTVTVSGSIWVPILPSQPSI